MHVSGRAIDFQLRLNLSDREFLTLLRSSEERSSIPSSPAKTVLKPQPKKRAAISPQRRDHTDVLARYSGSKDSVTLFGFLHAKRPVRLVLRPGSKSYANLLRFLCRELLSVKENVATLRALPNEPRQALTAFKSHLEQVLHEENGQQLEAVELQDIVDVYRCDFERVEPLKEEGLDWKSAGRNYGLRIVDERTGEQLFQAPRSTDARTFRYFSGASPQLVSGFLSLEEKISASTQAALPPEIKWHEQIKFISAQTVTIEQGRCIFRTSFSLPQELLSEVSLIVHWGALCGAVWTDEDCSQSEYSLQPDGTVVVAKCISPWLAGLHGACLSFALNNSAQRAWAREFAREDAQFEVPSALLASSVKLVREEQHQNLTLQGKLLHGLADFTRFVKTINHLVGGQSSRRLARLLYDVTKDREELRHLLGQYYRECLFALESKHPELPRHALLRTLRILSNIGIGEVVLVTPEGPHAVAGGLAQVIVGLSKALSREGVATTVISPLYEEEQGSRHRGAEKVIAEGIQILEQMVPLRLVGEIKVRYGATRISGTVEEKKFPRVVPVQVYLAEYGVLRFFFLRHKLLANRLYHFDSSEDQLRKAIFLSRGALELIRERKFGIAADIIISNDWLASLVPTLLRCDPRYFERGPFAGVETAHLIHNAGKAFQGRLFVNQFGEDLWPMLGLADKHFFGLADPSDRSQLNLTAGALHHTSKALVTVSKPYAQQLLSPTAGDGLELLFQRRRESLFGISNGVDLDALRGIFRELGESARNSLGLGPAIRGTRVSQARILGKLSAFKKATKNTVQEKYSLEQRNDAILLSLVGRITEQKGVQLLTGNLPGHAQCVLETILQRFVGVQVLIAGPLNQEESEIRAFHERYLRLLAKYPGRVGGVFNFIPHREALEITHASDFFLMPSRYEPGGITQLEALAAGTLVIAHNVGGIAATLKQYAPESETGDSFLFNSFDSSALYEMICWALDVYSDRRHRRNLVAQAVLAKNDWSDRVSTYLALLQNVSGVFNEHAPYPHLAMRQQLLEAVRANDVGLV